MYRITEMIGKLMGWCPCQETVSAAQPGKSDHDTGSGGRNGLLMIRWSRLAMIGIVALAFLIGVTVYPTMPDEIPSHWNAAGEVDDYLPAFWGVFLLPILLAGVAVLFLFVVPALDARVEATAEAGKRYDAFGLVTTLFLFAVYVSTILWAQGIEVSMSAFLAVSFGIMEIAMGFLMKKGLEQNSFVGIRTPWTLADERVWQITHERAGVAFQVAGILTLLTAAAPEVYGFVLLVMILAVVCIYLIWYSRQVYQRVVRRSEIR
ncbi:SdpI family protein [Methanofollis aquaemaris]|uniref:SdpI family protein n=1 Tax=Methanofollis aquaemaris TaxID=126734 RepID=A0A8A3S911_9EURY|nr:SdpI family protein [Methanofollis aquaemaris]QSZ68016.1 SdpI family protein [Methanofollis aquaemaris]